MTNLLNLRQLISSDNVNDLRKIYDTVKTQFRSLENPDIQSKVCRPLLIPVLLPKLSSELSLIINQQFDEKDCQNVRLNLKCLEFEIITREKLHYTSKSLNGDSDFHYQRQCYIFPLIKIGKLLNMDFVTKQIINPNFIILSLISLKEKEFF